MSGGRGQRDRSKPAVIGALGLAQLLAWASTYYLPAVLADPIAASLGVPRTWVFAVFSGSLLLSAALGPMAGRAVDRHGGRPVLALSNLVLAAGLVLLAASHGIGGLTLAWSVLGIGMSLGLYGTAFAALAVAYGGAARAPITGITLIAGFASTVGWPATVLIADALDWRWASLIWAALHLVVGLPLNLFLPRARVSSRYPDLTQDATGTGVGSRTMWLLAFIFAVTLFVAGALAAHLPRLLRDFGAAPAAALGASALVGPAQVGARFCEFGMQRWFRPLASARLASVLHPLGATLLAVYGPPAALAFALLHGAGNGLLTIAKGTLPLAIFGPDGYGLRTGLISAPSRVASAVAPFAFGYLLDSTGPRGALTVSSGLCLSALIALLVLQVRPAQPISSADAAGPA